MHFRVIINQKEHSLQESRLMLFSIKKNARLAVPLSVLPHRFGKITCIIIYNFTNKVHFACVSIRHFSLLNVNAAGACGYDFLCDGGQLVRAYVRLRRGAI